MRPDQQALLDAAASMLEPPLERGFSDLGTNQRPMIVGGVRGRRVAVIANLSRPSYTLHPNLHVPAATFGLRCLVTQRLANPGGPTLGADPVFDAEYAVEGAPRAVLQALFDEELRGWTLRAAPATIHFEPDRLEILGRGPGSPDTLRAQVWLGVRLAERLPEAITAGGAGAWLARGSLVDHPEVVAAGRKNALLTTVLVLAVLGIAGGIGYLVIRFL